MLRLSPLALLFAAQLAAAQAPAPAPSTTPPAATTPTPAQPATLTPATPTNQLAARLTPGGVLDSGSSFPLGMQLNLSNSLGNGILAPGYQAQPQWSTSLSLVPNVRIPKLDGIPRMALSGSVNFSVNNWLFAYSNGGVYERQVRVSDAGVRLTLPGLYTEEFTGIGISPGITASVPLSITSRQANLVTSIGASLPFSWPAPETPIGSFFLQYVVSARGSVFSQVAATMPCSGLRDYGTPRPLGDPVNGTDELPTFIPAREEQYLDDGTCLLPGRQRLFGVNQGFNASWSSPGDGAHSVSLGLGWSHSFLRPLAAKPELSSPFASGQNFNESTSGSLSYSYTVPVDFPFTLSLSAGSDQSAYVVLPDGAQVLRFPFWDFINPANNNSGVSFDISVGI